MEGYNTRKIFRKKLIIVTAALFLFFCLILTINSSGGELTYSTTDLQGILYPKLTANNTVLYEKSGEFWSYNIQSKESSSLSNVFIFSKISDIKWADNDTKILLLASQYERGDILYNSLRDHGLLVTDSINWWEIDLKNGSVSLVSQNDTVTGVSWSRGTEEYVFTTIQNNKTTFFKKSFGKQPAAILSINDYASIIKYDDSSLEYSQTSKSKTTLQKIDIKTKAKVFSIDSEMIKSSAEGSEAIYLDSPKSQDEGDVLDAGKLIRLSGDGKKKTLEKNFYGDFAWSSQKQEWFALNFINQDIYTGTGEQVKKNKLKEKDLNFNGTSIFGFEKGVAAFLNTEGEVFFIKLK